MSASMAEVLAEHQVEGRGMTYGSPDTCLCGAKTYAERGDEDVTVRRTRAIAAHQEAMLAANGYGKLGFEGGIWTMTDAEFKQELATAGARALEEAAGVLSRNVVRDPLGKATFENYADWLRPRAAQGYAKLESPAKSLETEQTPAEN